MNNIPKVKVGIVAVSRDCFPESLSVNRRKALVKAYADKYSADDIYECPVCIVESEIHMKQALEDIKKQAATRFACILVISDRKSAKLCSRSSLTDLRCLWRLLKKISARFQMTAEMRTAVCLMRAIT